MTHKATAALHSFRALFQLNFLPESWRKHLDLIRNQSFQPYLIIAFTLWLVGVVEVVQKITGQRLDPRFWMLIAVLITGYTGARIFRLSAPISNVRRSNRSHEVENILSRLVRGGFAVYQEPGPGKGSDGYVIVGSSGVYALEIKATEVFGSRTIQFRSDDELVLGGRIYDRRPVQYAHKTANRVRERFHGVSQVQAAIKPLVVFVKDWQINQRDGESHVPVLNANQLEQYFGAQPTIFTKSQLAEISSYLDESGASSR